MTNEHITPAHVSCYPMSLGVVQTLHYDVKLQILMIKMLSV